MTKVRRMYAVNFRLKETGFDNFSGRQCCRLCREVVLSPQSFRSLLLLWQQPHRWFTKYFGITCSIWNPFKPPECARLHSRELQSQKLFPREHPPETPYKSAPFAVLMGAIAPKHIATHVYYMFRPPLSQNPLSTPVNICWAWYSKLYFISLQL